jgi:hypothetical protein
MVAASIESRPYSSARDLPAQIMAVEDVAGYKASDIRSGLDGSGGTAVFVRYLTSPSCTPLPAPDGAPDSAGVNGLYVGYPRPAGQWIDGRPTFDIFTAPHFPLPQRLTGPSGHLVFRRAASGPVMSAAELFTMYRALWSESVSVGDTSAERRLRRWLASHPDMARKSPMSEVAERMVRAVADARIVAHPVPLGGTFAITIVVPGGDSTVIYGQTTRWTRPWIGDAIRDSATGIQVASVLRSFAVDIVTLASLEGLGTGAMRTNPCPPIPIIVDDLPIVVDADSAWHGTMHPAGFLSCVPAGSPIAELTRTEKMPSLESRSGTVTFRRHRDGRVSFETTLHGDPGVRVHGERIRTATYDIRFD